MAFFRKRTQPLKPKKSFARKARNVVAGGIIAATLFGGFRHSPKPFVLPEPIPKETLKGHEKEHGVAIFSYRADFKASLGKFFNPIPDSGYEFQRWVMKNKKKDWFKFLKKTIPSADYRKAIFLNPERDTDWLTEKQALALHNKLIEYQRSWNGEKFREGVRKGEISEQKIKDGLFKAGTDTTGKSIKFKADSTGYEIIQRNRKRRKSFVTRRIGRRDSRR
ncbi:MAG: hypothetical protein Q7K42_01820 [Candidatus Diapherotrites archaeon]|nr:hypothetical protein [Candidatus Diapherotrites archaeon]